MRGGLTPDALAARVAALAGEAFDDATMLAVAVSGGADSLALLALCRAAFGTARIAALTVDHGLRSESAAEAAHVAMLCAAAGIRYATLRWEGPHPAAGVQAAARTARYALMTGWCRAQGFPLLLTAHHADDQAETLLMRLHRGSGLSGLAGVRAARELNGIRLMRPLLDVRRAALRATLPREWRPVDDPSNVDDRFTRTRARKLLHAGWPGASGIAASAAHLAEAEEALSWVTERAMAGNVDNHDGVLIIDTAGLPPELTRRLLIACFARLGLREPRGPDLARLMARLAAGGSGTLSGAQLRVQPDGRWRMRGVAPPRAASKLAEKREEP